MNERIFMTILVLAILLFCIVGVYATPNGATLSYINSTTGQVTAATSAPAAAGNVTELNIGGSSVTQSWQGYFGNVSGSLKLADGSGNVMYNWTQVTAKGEVYASTNSSITWSTIDCFNMTSTLYVNRTSLDTMFGIAPTDIDGIGSTFINNNHAAFYVGSKSFSANQCNSTKVYGPGGTGTFDEALLYDTTSNSTVFTSILKDKTTGFDNRPHDFEMLVLEDGHGSNTATTPYYFFLELG